MRRPVAPGESKPLLLTVLCASLIVVSVIAQQVDPPKSFADLAKPSTEVVMTPEYAKVLAATV